MSKYSKELKLKIVLNYIKKHISPEQQEKAYGVSSSQIRHLLRILQINEEGKNERSKIKKLSYF